jgi:hypothetical protein
MRKAWLPLAFCLLAAATANAAEKLTYVDLVKRLTDLERLSLLPEPGEQCAQASSYDRASRYDAVADKYVAWDANGDGGGIIRKEGDKLVIAEMEGPGCIWRIWSAMPEKGHVRIYLDGAAEPVVDLPFVGYFNHENKPFTRPVLVHTVARGWNSYVPIPYKKSCKVVADQGWGNYYHFTYGTFPKGTEVPTFSRELSAEESEALDAADKALAEGGVDPAGKRPGEKVAKETVAVAAGATARVAELTGPRAITAIRVKLDLPEYPEDRAVLRELALRITWDDDREAAVWAPLGDFFGTADGAQPYRSLPSGLTKDGQWYSLWYMPFGSRAKVELINDGKAARKVAFEITHAPLALPLEKLGRFHAKWHRDALLPKEPERAIDWPMLKVEGRGRFCGVLLHVWNPKGGWWGEGDEKFFVDGEKFPSTFGTGSEDYFGYAWCCPDLFQNAYHNQPISHGNKGHVAVNRWHITDNVPFQKAFEADIEKYYPNSKPTLYASTAYFYLAPGTSDPYQAAPITERVGYDVAPETVGVKGALEGERLKILSKTRGDANEQDLTDRGSGWSGDSQLWWTNAKPGDKLELALPVKAAGKFKLVANLTKAADYGIVQLSLDGKKLGEPIDLFNNGVVPTKPLDLGTHDLAAGQHVLAVEIVGANPKAVKAYMFGLDYVKLEPAK